jgi:hypothetical protein
LAQFACHETFSLTANTPPFGTTIENDESSEMPGANIVLRTIENIVTGDESWFARELQHSTKWSISPEDAAEKARQQINTKRPCLLRSGE